MPEGVPALPPDATPEQKDRHWFQHVYQGDKMPQFTVRAVLMGGILGMLMSASNLYTTLSIGWAFGVAITACVMSYVIWTIVRAITLNRVSKMSILENTCMASTASAAGYSTGSTIATMFGALMILHAVPAGQTSADVKTWDIQPVWLVATFTFLTGAMGCFLAIPMKRQMINHEQLPFPSGIAAAETLKSLYSESKEALHKAYALVVSLLVGAIVGIFNTGEGTLIYIDRAMEKAKHMLGFEPRLPEQLPASGFMQVQGKPLIGFGFEPSVLLIAAGMIVGVRVCFSMLLGSVLLYCFVAPSLINMDVARASETNYIPSIELVAGGTIYHVYRWGLWGGTALMVFASLTSLAMQWKTMGRAFGKFFKKEEAGEHSELEGRMAQIEVPTLWLILGMVPITIGMVVLQYMAFQISIVAGLIAVALSFVLSLVACRATGETDTTPIGAMGKVMQLTFAALHPGKIIPNLASAGIAANSASSSADLLTDLKSGYLLGANPRKQFLAQFAGIFFGTIAIVPVWYLMVPTKAALEKFPAPATNQWARVAQVLTEGIDKLPMSAQYAIVIGALLGVLLPVGEKLIPQSARKYWPSAMGLGLSWVLPFANALAFMIGAIIAWIWEKLNSKSAEVFTVPIASGLVAGESLIKAIIAMTATVVGLLGWDK
ncbi:MAG: OPT family oligopeptide transporter [Planctomycetota bacterium]|nr:OPT family oligopeptide transporter [Planctomycetota bacterium]